ncbi:MAG: hypothetical protein HOV87_30245 [Catenulispora sp.]|nr:hypothetical protein [Catenulispora sp.]
MAGIAGCRTSTGSTSAPAATGATVPSTTSTTNAGSTSASGSAPAAATKPSTVAALKGSIRAVFAPPAGTSPAAVEQLVANLRHRAKEAKLDDVTVTARGSSIEMTGRAAEKDQILALAAPGVLQFRIVITSADATDHGQPTGNVGFASAVTIQDFVAADCAKQTPQTGRAMIPEAAIAACDLNHRTKYLLDAAAIEGAALTGASAAQESTGGQNAALAGSWEVDLSFNAAGTAEFAKITQELSQNMGLFATVMDGTVYIAATVQAPITDGKVRITGAFSKEQAESLAAMLQTGALPVRLTQTEVDTYS